MTSPVTPRQLETMRIIRRAEQKTANGITRSELTAALGKSAKRMLQTLRIAGWAEHEGPRWNLTDEGIDVLERGIPKPARPKIALPPPTVRFPDNHWTVRACEVIDATASEHGITREELMSRACLPRFLLARKLAMARVRELGFSYPEIGLIFGRDHTTVIHACRKAAALLDEKVAAE